MRCHWNIFLLCILFSSWCYGQESPTDTLPDAHLTEVVVTGTKTFKRKTESPVIVQVLDSKSLSNLQVCNLSEGLKFQPGLRVETNCQTCNYTQLRMNGLQGGYSQILINGRPVFSPLMSLYGLEQLPVNMIERIEVVRGGGSSLYGSSAVGGTVNVITKMPRKNYFEVHTLYQYIGGRTGDLVLSGNGSLVNDKRTSGLSLFLNRRSRGMYDANGDQFSEIPSLENTAAGIQAFLMPSDNQKLEWNVSYLNEYRLGGDMSGLAAHLSQQSEERTHRIWLANADYQIRFDQDRSSLITYFALQRTDRDHYTGIFPDSASDIALHLEQPPYGTSGTTTLQGGFQLDYRLTTFQSENILTLGAELLSDRVRDEIPAYGYAIDQHARDLGFFFQSDWKILSRFTLLSGIRVDHHNLVGRMIASPRWACLYQWKKNAQLRVSYGNGFRAPQAFDADMHIAFAGGGVSRVQLAPDLREERSRSWSASFNYDKATEKWIAGFTLEAFHTKLARAFVLEPAGEDSYGLIFEKRNGQDATVQGFTGECRFHYNKKIQAELGFTWQHSAYREAVSYLADAAPLKAFLRTPDDYGFASLSYTPKGNWGFFVNAVYTGRMFLSHIGGADNFETDAMVVTPRFMEVNTKLVFTQHWHDLSTDIEWYGGVKNIFNAYQTDFDTGKNRDSNYIYGPSLPRTFFIGIKLKPE